MSDASQVYKITPLRVKRALEAMLALIRYMYVTGRKLQFDGSICGQLAADNPTCLPGEIWAEIFGWCDPLTLRCAMIACKYFHDIIPSVLLRQISTAQAGTESPNSRVKYEIAEHVSGVGEREIQNFHLLSQGEYELQIDISLGLANFAQLNAEEMFEKLLTAEMISFSRIYSDSSSFWDNINKTTKIKHCHADLGHLVQVKLCKCCHKMVQISQGWDGAKVEIEWPSCGRLSVVTVRLPETAQTFPLIGGIRGITLRSFAAMMAKQEQHGKDIADLFGLIAMCY